MGAYIIDHNITLGEHEIALSFCKACYDELKEHVAVTIINNEMAMETSKPKDEDVLIFFNRTDAKYPEYFNCFLQDALKTKCAIFPVAISEAHRFPPQEGVLHQSFDIVEQLQQRKLTVAQIETVAVAFARTVISALQPTLTKNNMCLFLSHRRYDGERIAGAFHDALQVRMQHTFRDINSVLVGENAQEVIKKNLRKSDAVVFLDTPHCGESSWVEFELRTALFMQIPIVWIKVGPDSERVKLKVVPSGVPHFRLPDIDLQTREMDSSIVDATIHKAFEISREYAKNVFGHLRRIKLLANKSSITLEELSLKYLTYQVQLPRRRFRYSQRPMTHVVGFYGRIPQQDDQQVFLNNLKGFGYEPHPRRGCGYDAALMLAPTALQNEQKLEHDSNLIDSCDEYISSLEHYLRSLTDPISPKRKGIIISGAFPDCEPDHQQHLTDAVHAFTREILDRKGIVIFGAHPTFQHLIFDMAKQRNPDDFVKSVHLYVSKYFVTSAAINEFKNYATTVATDNIDDDRAKSLSVMRKAMIQDKEAIGMVVMGGKTKRLDLSPGVDEEVELAQNAGIPVFYIGSVGGRSAELASVLGENKWREKPNHLSSSFNHELMVSLDYNLLAKELLDQLGL